MTDYKKIQGFEVQTLSSDPTEPGWIGSIFYNSTSGTFKTVKLGGVTAGTWASGGNLNLARSGAAAFGIQTSTVFTGGEGTPGKVGNTEVYNGTSWTEVNDLNTIRTSMGGSGNSSSTGLIFAGILPPASSPRYTGLTESWDGTNWTEIADVNTGRSGGSGFGKSSTAALYAGGEYGGVPAGTVTELWNGTSWTEVNDLNTGRIFTGPSGISTDGMISGGFNGSTVIYANVETWNGTSWTETTDINTARRSLGASGSTSTNQLIFKGNIAPGPNVANTESWNGSTWTEVNDAAVATYYITGTGTSNLSALAAGGGPPFTASTEEWTAPDVIINTLTTS